MTSSNNDILTTAKIIRAERERERRAAIKQKILEQTQDPGELKTTVRYPIIYADPPWRYPFGKTNRNPVNHYSTMSLQDICDLPVGQLATPDALLFLWTTNSFLADAFKVIESWGFRYVSNMVWTKDRLGLGFFVRNQHELLLIAKRGKIPVPEPRDRPSSVIAAPRAEHSKKPDRVYDIIEQMYPDLPRIELFARASRPGWDRWGNAILTDSTPFSSAQFSPF